MRQRARELEDLIALGTATLLAAEMISGSKPASSSSAPAPRAVAVPDVSADPKMAADLAAAPEKSKDDLQSRLSKAQK